MFKDNFFLFLFSTVLIVSVVGKTAAVVVIDNIFFSPETDSGSESLKLSCQISIASMPEAAINAESISSLTSSLKDKMKMEKVITINYFPLVRMCIIILKENQSSING